MTIASKQPKFSVRSSILLTLSLIALGASAQANSGDTAATTLPDESSVEQVVTTPTTKAAETTVTEMSSLSAYDQQTILQKYDHLDPNHIVPTQALVDALTYFEKNKSSFSNQNYISIINFAQSSKTKRFYIINLSTGSVWAIHTAHGKGSDPDHDGYANSFSNVSGSNKSSLGFYRTAETYSGSHGLSLRLDGLSSTNSNARARAIVIHGASYVQEASVIQGRSWGCPAVTMDYRDSVIKALKGGSLIYAVVDNGGTGLLTTTSTSSSSTTSSSTSTSSNSSGSGTATTETNSTYKMVPLSWENSANPERKAWSQYLQQLVLNDWSGLLKGADDMKNFCPKYSSLNNNQRANVWAQLFVSMARYESAYNPLSRMQETTMGTDPITKKPVYSEGLLQLSYQDIQWAKYCKFNWSKDKSLSSTSSKKTILDPYINLHCGVGIMADQVKRKGLIAVGSGAYWAVIKTNSKYNKLTSIKSMVKSLSICQ